MTNGWKASPRKTGLTRDEETAVVGVLREHWEQIAATAYLGYLTQGRGIMYMEIDLRVPATDDILGGKGMLYLSERAVLDRVGEWPDEPIAKKVRTYDPETEVFMVVRWEPGRYSMFPVQAPHLSPKEAYEQGRRIAPSA
jgi:hypothetical protein